MELQEGLLKANTLLIGSHRTRRARVPVIHHGTGRGMGRMGTLKLAATHLYRHCRAGDVIRGVRVERERCCLRLTCLQ